MDRQAAKEMSWLGKARHRNALIHMHKCDVIFDWHHYKGKMIFASFNFNATKRANRPMIDICYCATKAMNNISEKTVIYKKEDFQNHECKNKIQEER